ncbi:LapA family protein [Andreprevotia chitinilytica]|uniref:LapA family protein n=1 Tax=Andreprevotia chitinilytica TaxID=396808 RepID=UPI0005574A30|nr:LapA family protein [Andreprevotia chitinilytica]
MRYLLWLIQFVVFCVLLGFALNNAEPVTLNFFFGKAWTASLSIQLFVCFAVGVLCGMLALVTKVIRYRREMIKLRRELRSRNTITPPAPDVVFEQPRDAV